MKVTAKMILPMVLIVLFGILMPFIFILSIYFGITNHDSINTTQSRPLSSSLSIDSTQRLQQQQLQQRNQHDNTIDKAFQKDSIKKASLIPKKSEQSINIYKRIHELFDMGLKDPKTLHNILSTEDIFGVSNIPFSDTSTFTSCPPSQSLVDYEDITNNHNLNMFRNGTPGAFVFFQHLRKAGGTGFCDLATRNMGQKAIPPYYCMPDNKGSLATPPWDESKYLIENLQNHHHRIAANEWDVFLEEHASIPGAVLSTTARDPVDRWYSQYRFEHLEHRDGSQSGDTRTPMVKWYKNQRGWTMGENYYIKTFIGDKDKVVPTNANGDFYWTYHKYHMKKLTWQQFEKAIINIRKFHVILITEWLNTSMPVITRVLDWKVPPRQVLPHEVQAVREQKKSLTAKQILSVEDFQYLVYDNVLDLLFFQIMKRIYLERLFCRK